MQSLAQSQVIDAIGRVIFVSAFQQSEVERVFGSFRTASVIGNGIAPAFEHMFTSPDELLHAKLNRAAYTATPYRGLAVLVRAMKGFARATTLDLFSSMRVYQSTDDDYAALFKQAAQNPAITQHGSLRQGELAQALRSCAFLFYPSIYPETFCIAAAEAMAAGMKVVTMRLGALEETTMGFADLVPLTTNDGDALALTFQSAMYRAVDHFTAQPQEWAQEMFAQSQRANELFTWASRAQMWEKILSR
jgi:glycosyltransferase involved in cell wall biosynthesis